MGHRPLPFRWKPEIPSKREPSSTFSDLAAITRDFEKNLFALEQAKIDFQSFHCRWRMLAENIGEEELMAAMDLLLAEFSVASERNKRCLNDAKAHFADPVQASVPVPVSEPVVPIPSMSWRERLDKQL